jgi:hypothetical protein
MPYAIDTLRQFRTPVYGIYNARERREAEPTQVNEGLTQALLGENKKLQTHIRSRVETLVQVIDVAGRNSTDEGMKLAILNCDGIAEGSAEWNALHKKYGVRKLDQTRAIDYQLSYPLIFWEGKGGCGIRKCEQVNKPRTLIRRVLICLLLQPREHFIHSLETLREEFMCATYGRLVISVSGGCWPRSMPFSLAKTRCKGTKQATQKNSD